MYRLLIRKDGKRHHVGYYTSPQKRNAARTKWLLEYERKKAEPEPEIVVRSVAIAIARYRDNYRGRDNGRLHGMAWWEKRIGHRQIDLVIRADIRD